MAGLCRCHVELPVEEQHGYPVVVRVSEASCAVLDELDLAVQAFCGGIRQKALNARIPVVREVDIHLVTGDFKADSVHSF